MKISDKNLSKEQIEYINDWSNGAFFGGPIWAFINGLNREALFCFIPIYGIYIWIKLAENGKKIIWEKERWNNFEEFKKHQKIAAWMVSTLVIPFAILISLF